MAGVAELRAGLGLPARLDPEGRALPVLDALRPLLPDGLGRGDTLAVRGSASLAMAVAAGPARAGRWVAGAGWDDFGLVAAHELGLTWDRLVLVDLPGEHRPWAAAVAVVVDAFDVVVLRPRVPVTAAVARRMSARCRERGTVLIVMARDRGGWPATPDVQLRLVASTWLGLGQGEGHLQGRRVAIEAEGRGRFSRPRRVQMWLPAADGGVRPLAEPVPAMSARPRQSGTGLLEGTGWLSHGPGGPDRSSLVAVP